jgi:uncharacterized protein (DUF983 family)
MNSKDFREQYSIYVSVLTVICSIFMIVISPPVYVALIIWFSMVIFIPLTILGKMIVDVLYDLYSKYFM